MDKQTAKELSKKYNENKNPKYRPEGQVWKPFLTDWRQSKKYIIVTPDYAATGDGFIYCRY